MKIVFDPSQFRPGWTLLGSNFGQSFLRKREHVWVDGSGIHSLRQYSQYATDWRFVDTRRNSSFIEWDESAGVVDCNLAPSHAPHRERYVMTQQASRVFMCNDIQCDFDKLSRRKIVSRLFDWQMEGRWYPYFFHLKEIPMRLLFQRSKEYLLLYPMS